MKVHLKQIPANGLHLDGDEDCPIPELEPEGIRCLGPLFYNIDIGVSGGALWANGSLSQGVELKCVCCLEEFVYEIKVPAFALRIELQGPETVDLTPFMREDLLLNLPAHPRCDRDGGVNGLPHTIGAAAPSICVNTRSMACSCVSRCSGRCRRALSACSK